MSPDKEEQILTGTYLANTPTSYRASQHVRPRTPPARLMLNVSPPDSIMPSYYFQGYLAKSMPEVEQDASSEEPTLLLPKIFAPMHANAASKFHPAVQSDKPTSRDGDHAFSELETSIPLQGLPIHKLPAARFGFVDTCETHTERSPTCPRSADNGNPLTARIPSVEEPKPMTPVPERSFLEIDETDAEQSYPQLGQPGSHLKRSRTSFPYMEIFVTPPTHQNGFHEEYKYSSNPRAEYTSSGNWPRAPLHRVSSGITQSAKALSIKSCTPSYAETSTLPGVRMTPTRSSFYTHDESPSLPLAYQTKSTFFSMGNAPSNGTPKPTRRLPYHIFASASPVARESPSRAACSPSQTPTHLHKQPIHLPRNSLDNMQNNETISLATSPASSHTARSTISYPPAVPSKSTLYLHMPSYEPRGPNVTHPTTRHINDSSPQPIHRPPPPLVALAGFLILLNTQGLNQAYGVFQAYYTTTHLPSSSPSTIAWIGSTQIALLFFMCIVTGSLALKTLSSRTFNLSSLLLVLSVLTTSFCQNDKHWQFLITQGILSGVSIGLIFGSGIDLITILAPNLGSLGTAVVSSGGAVGGALYTTLSSQLLYYIGFGWTVRLLALVILTTLIPSNIILRQHSPPPTPPIEQPSWDRRKTYLSPPFALSTAGLGIALCGVYSLFYYHITSALSTHQSWSRASAVLIAFNAGNFPGRFAPLIPMKSLSPATAAAICTLLGSMLLYLGVTTSYTGTILILVFYGILIGGIQSLYSAIVGGTCEGRKERLTLVLNISGLGCLLGPPVGGVLIQATNGYVGVQGFAGTALLVGGLLFLSSIWAARRKNVITV